MVVFPVNYSNDNACVSSELAHLIVHLGDELHKHKKKLILVLPPPMKPGLVFNLVGISNYQCTIL